MTVAARLGLGTVQFGQAYGIANRRGQIPAGEAAAILQRALDEGADLLDTAGAYGESETVLGGFSKSHPSSFRVVSKFSSTGEYRDGMLAKTLRQSLARLNLPRIYGYLAHHARDLQCNDGLWAEMRQLKKQGLVEKIGVSLYRPPELEEFENRGLEFDLVQVPYSIFDRRFEPHFEGLKARGVEVHVRSVFVQGLVFRSPESLPAFFAPAQPSLRQLQAIAQETRLPVQDLSLNFVLANRHIDRVIIGVDGLDHFEANLKALKNFDAVQGLLERLQALKIDHEDVVLPYKWPPS